MPGFAGPGFVLGAAGGERLRLPVPMARFPFPTVAAAVLLAACGAPDRTSAGPAPAAEPAPAHASKPAAPHDAMDFYSLTLRSLEGEPVDLARWRGKVALVVNVASECGFTPQYAGLQALHQELQGRGFTVLGFPSNDFGQQEPGTPAEIRAFCTEKYRVDFPLFEKVQTRPGTGQSAVYELLGKATGKLPNWNFCKYVVGKDGKVRQFFESRTAPDSKALRDAIDAALQ